MVIFENIPRSIINDIDILFNILLIFILSFSILKIFKIVIIKKIKKFVEETDIKYHDMLVEIIDKIGWPFYVLISLYITFYYLQTIDFGGVLLSDIRKIIYYAIITLAVYYAVKAIHILIDYSTKFLVKKRENDIDTSTIDLLNKILKGGLWLLAIFLILSNLGYNVTTLIAGLGIGGIAVAFALQNILGDIFASFSIHFDKPFKIGDYILFEGIEGTVKRIGIKSTRIEALQGHEIVVSNKQLTETVVNNYKNMDYRRILFNFSVKYDTGLQKLEKIPGIIKDIIDNIDMATYKRVHFSKFGDFGYIFEVVYFVNSNEYDRYMDVQQQINFEITKKFENEGIEISAPAKYLLTQSEKRW